MKIVVIASHAPSLVNFRGPLLLRFTNAGHQVLACAPEEDENTKNTLAQMGIEYRRIHLSRTGMNLVQDISTILSLMSIFRDFSPDLTLSYTVKPVIYGSVAARLMNVKKIFSMITGLGYAFVESDSRNMKQGFIRWLIKLQYRLALSVNSSVFFQNPDDEALFIDLGLVHAKKTVRINGSGVDILHYAATSVPQHPYPVFLLIARLLKDKGVIEYVQSATILKRKYPDTIFRLIGWVDENNPASIDSTLLTKWQNEGNIEYLGTKSDVRHYIAECSVYVLPSYREGTPRTVLEAMSMGRPIVTTDAPGCRETVIDNENGFLVPVRDPIALAEAMEKFISQPELIKTMGQRSREIAEDKYDVHKVNEVILRTMGLLAQ